MIKEKGGGGGESITSFLIEDPKIKQNPLELCIFLNQGLLDFSQVLVDSLQYILGPWCGGYHHCSTSFNKAWSQALNRFKS